jgi:hypothetical protein
MACRRLTADARAQDVIRGMYEKLHAANKAQYLKVYWCVCAARARSFDQLMARQVCR